MIDRPFLAIAAAAAVAGVVLWGRTARRQLRVARRIDAGAGPDSESSQLAWGGFHQDMHALFFYGVAALGLVAATVSDEGWVDWLGLLILVPMAITLRHASDFGRLARLTESRSQVEQRAEDVLSQEALAPRRWAARLAPETVPEMPGFEMGSLYRAGTGMMAGDFYDVFRTGPSRVAVVIGDVTGHGIEPSITAFQAKYLLRVFLRQFRDPGQALEELNTQVMGMGRGEEFISICVVVFDTEMETLRYASAGHPAAFLWHGGDPRYLTATGPLVSLDPQADYASRELPLRADDLVLLYTDGLTEARSGEQLFGEERVSQVLRRDPGVDPEVLCKTLVEAAEDFATVPITDDIAILAVRRLGPEPE